MKPRLWRAAVGLGALAVMALALTSLHHELQRVHYRDVAAEMKAIPTGLLVLALSLTMASYAIAGINDWLALRYAGRPQPLRTSALVGFVATAFSNTVGFSLLSGGSIRYRFYSALGLQAADTAKVVGFVITSFWLGFLTLGGAVLTSMPPPFPAVLASPIHSLRVLGLLFLAIALMYLVLVTVRRHPFVFRGFAFSLPRPRQVAAQMVVASFDWLLAAGVLAALLHGSGLPLTAVLAVFLLAQFIGVVSHVPGGLGVFESVFVLFFSARAPAATILGALLAFRAVYYLLPFGAAAATLVGIEIARRRHSLSGAVATLGRAASPFVPALFAIAAFLAGAVLLASGSTPSLPGRARAVRHLVGLPVMEMSHLAASVVGALLLVLARGLQRRLDSAYAMSLVLLIAGAALSLLKALDWEEALVLTAVAFALAPFRQAFYRRTSLLAEPLSAQWLSAVSSVLVGTTWLGFFAAKHVSYSHELWWHFALHGDASRFLRACVAVAVVMIVLAFARLLNGSRPRAHPPSAVDLEAAREVVARSPATEANLALTGDKAFLFNDTRTAFVMYGQAGRSFIAMGDPVGAPEERRELIWRFHDMADRSGQHTVFYEVAGENLPLYLDVGLQFEKLGEEALVDLGEFSLEGHERKSLRGTVKRLQKEGLRFAVMTPPDVPALLPRLQEVSDAWLAGKRTREKSFSLGAFNPSYIMASPVAVLWKDERLLAFANLWLGAGRRELSVDLMRHSPDAPPGTMEYLFVSIMQWGRDHAYATFDLGMAPLSGLEQGVRSPVWGRLATLLYRHGEHFYNFQGLRAYKEKFRPRWRPKYLASPGGLVLPLVLANLASLISGGLVGVVAKTGVRA